jgi:radical SAM protein with 4Fe4S-binding SPASM domain
VRLRDGVRRHAWTPELARKLLCPAGARLFACAACDGHSACVDAYGRVQPCMGIRAPALTCQVAQAPGCEHGSLGHALERFRRFGTLEATNPGYLRRCAVCFLKGICESCPAKSWAEDGTLDTPVEYQCEVAHALSRHLGWLGKDEHGWEVADGWERVEPR